MKFSEHKGKCKYKIEYITYVNVKRDCGYLYIRNKGKVRNSIIFVEAGEIKYTFLKTNKSLLLKKDDFVYIPKNIPYKAEYMKDDTKIRTITFSTESDILPVELKHPINSKNSDVTDAIMSITEEWSNNSLFLSAKIYEILFLLTKKEHNIPDMYKKILPAIEEIRKNYFENKKTIYYADLCRMSQSNFRRLFKEFTGKSFIKYRNDIRIKEAKKLIESGEFTVSEAAYVTGFNNMSFFYECYNK